ncbi:hypothetical protein L1987_21700 [Smallanthus sonchifolius]|uniref:Uncharacterized protein n=1 Tax=Smallanthus sonchifolius TaxID=185202 RepID=A0ACB9ICU8_9ASTR|nr:hypothetical protein L1987_21700 [Smallanthus sonchifolius]
MRRRATDSKPRSNACKCLFASPVEHFVSLASIFCPNFRSDRESAVDRDDVDENLGFFMKRMRRFRKLDRLRGVFTPVNFISTG